MQRFVVGQPATLTVEIKDATGAPVTPTSLTAEVKAESGALVQTVSPALASPAVISIDNTLDPVPLTLAELRTLRVSYGWLDGQGIQQSAAMDVQFIAEPGVLVGRNSAVSEAVAEVYSGGLIGWAEATPEARRRALIMAYFRIGRLQLRPSLKGKQKPLNFNQPLPADLPQDFMAALRQAQLLEADSILGGEPERDRQKTGLLSESTGESSTMFRPAGYLKFAVSPRTLQALRGFVSMSLGVGRA